MLVLSLAVVILLLAIHYLLIYTRLIVQKIAVWASVAVFFIAAIYEPYLFSLVTRHMMQKLTPTKEQKENGEIR